MAKLSQLVQLAQFVKFDFFKLLKHITTYSIMLVYSTYIYKEFLKM